MPLSFAMRIHRLTTVAVSRLTCARSQAETRWRGLELLEARVLLSNSLLPAKASFAAESALLLAAQSSAVIQAPAAGFAADPAASFYVPPQRRLQETGGFLTAPAEGNAFDIAVAYLDEHAEELGLASADVRNFIVTSQYTDDASGTTHIYLRQTRQGIEIANADLSVNVAGDGSIINVGSSFVPGAGVPAADWPRRFVRPTEAFASLASALGLDMAESASELHVDAGSTDLKTTLSDAGVSLAPIPANMVYVPTADGLVLAWRLNVQTVDKDHWYDACCYASG